MKSAFTLIEVLIVIAILGLLAAAVLVAINPGKRLAETRDAQRRQDITSIANALIAYYSVYGQKYPPERSCDTSRGSDSPACNTSIPSGDNWNTGPISSYIYQELVAKDQAFKVNIPKDPINDTTYFYRYEPRDTSGNCVSGGSTCEYYWIGARLEAPKDPNKPIFRCSDDPTNLLSGPGCKETGPDAIFIMVQPND